MKNKPVNQMTLAELKQLEQVYAGRTDHVAQLMLARIREAIAILENR